MKRSNLFFCLGGLLAGIVLGLVIARIPASTAREPLTPPPSAAREETADPERDPACGTWDVERIYTGGDQVIYNGRIYRARWWTQGEVPGAADVWEDTLSAPAPSASRRPQPAPTGVADRPEGFKVVGYYPSWKPEEAECLRYDVLTHVVYAFAIPTADGGLLPLDNPDTARQILSDAHAAGIQVLLAVGGWSYQDVPLEATFTAATDTPEKRMALAGAIADMCEAFGFDGVDMDWEHPRVDGPSAGQYEALMLDLAGRLHRQGKVLTSAVVSGATADGNIYYDAAAHSDAVLEAVDWIHVMAYDGGDGARHSTYGFAVDCACYWRDQRGLPREKVVLGMPFYARPGWMGYGELAACVPAAADADHVAFDGMDVWYNGPDTIRAKTAYAASELGGVMIWEVTQDSADAALSLQSALASALSG